jgi:hypothetical protein
MTLKPFLLTFALAASAAAQAGIVVESVERNAKTGKTGDGTRLYIQGGAARFDQSLDRARTDYVIFRDDVLYIVEPGERSYAAMDRRSVDALAGQMGAAMQQMREQMAKLPPDQRKTMEQMMGGAVPGAKASPPPLVARDLGRSEKVEGRSCRLWELSRDTVVESQVCVVPFGDLPGKEDVLGLMQRMSAMMKPLSEAMQGFGSLSTDFEAMARVKAFPILWRDFEGGKPTGEETVMRAWREESVAPALLQVPKGFRQRDLLSAMQR